MGKPALLLCPPQCESVDETDAGRIRDTVGPMVSRMARTAVTWLLPGTDHWTNHARNTDFSNLLTSRNYKTIRTAMCLEYMLGPSFEIIPELQQSVNFPGKPTTWTARAMWHMAFSCVVAVLNFQGGLVAAWVSYSTRVLKCNGHPRLHGVGWRSCGDSLSFCQLGHQNHLRDLKRWA